MALEQVRPLWVKEWLERLEHGPTAGELKRRHKAVQAIKSMNLSIAPDRYRSTAGRTWNSHGPYS